MYKIFKIIIIGITIILIFFSAITFLIIQSDLLNSRIDFTPKGLNIYLNSFFQYSGLFAATITLIVAYFGIKRLEAADIANFEKIKLDRYSDWKIVTEIRINEIKDGNKGFIREFYKIRYNLFTDLYYDNLSIYDSKKLKEIFDKYFITRISFFEEMTNRNIEMGNIYKDGNYTYFFQNFYYIFIGSLDYTYEKVYDDLKILYLANLNPHRIIDEETFKSAQNNRKK